ncbi:hypothetical protein CPC16_007771 [Podila verticillata]|nr:hypothetical protein CPC16_007771 [Podila verticillata]KFH70355.1 hypothetical protein MVEG_03206 [Podila verticillata NRRL 6337]
MIAHAFKLDRFEPERIVTSNWVGPKTLAAVRFIETLYVWIVIVAVWISYDTAADYLKYFTNLTYFGLSVYLLCTSLWTIGYLRQPASSRGDWINTKAGGWLGYLHWLLYSTVICFHIVVPIVFWTLLSDGPIPTALGRWRNYSVHLLDGVLAISELVLNRHFLQPIHSLFVAGVMLFYMFLTFVVHKTQGTWVYPFLNWDQGPKAAIYYIGLCVGLFVVFFLLLLVHKYRNKWLANCAAKVNPELSHHEASHMAKVEGDVEAGMTEKHEL